MAALPQLQQQQQQHAHTLQRKMSHQQFHPGHQPSGSSVSVASTSAGSEAAAAGAPASSYNGQGSIATMQELYEVGEVIGTGTFGIIRKVTRRTDGLVLARKELDYGRMDERDLKQLNEEVNILQNLEPNENIVRYYERYVDRQKFRLHIIMEFCHNGDLAAQIQRCRRKNNLLREEVVWSYLTQIALALSDCHAEHDARGNPKQVILHRDIKPENVFLDKDNIIKLGDFGLSKAMANAAFTNTYVGTPYYMSPELINSQAYDQKSDIWALGCLIYELCAWHPPFHEARTQAELTKLIRDGRIPPLPNQYSRSLQDVIKSMLRQDPKQRPSIEMLKSLDEVKLQMRVLEMKKMHENILLARREVEMREAAVAERERVVALRERALEHERIDLAEHRSRLQQAYNDFQTYHAAASSSSGASTSGTSIGGTSSRDNSPIMEAKENAAAAAGAGAVMISEMGVSPPMVQAPDSASKTMQRVASRPSLVPRRPIEERRSMIGLNTLAKRMSCQSLAAMAVDGETPVKNGYGTPVATTGTESRRRIATSKSMHNLKTSGSSSRQQAFGGNDSPTSRALPPSSLAGSRQPTPTGGVYGTISSHPMISRPSSSSAVEGPTKRSNSSASIATIGPSPSKRPGAGRTSTAPPQLSTAGSLTAISAFATSHNTAQAMPSLPTITAGAPTIAPRWNLEDEENLPSPFLKKKASSTQSLRGVASAAATSLSSGMQRGFSTNNISSISSNAGGGSAPTTRQTRASTTRQSLGARLAMHRQQAKVDEQGRRLAAQ